MKNLARNIFLWVLSLGIMGIAFYQFYEKYKAPPKTLDAEMYIQRETLPITGIAVREEEIIPGSGSGYIIYNYADGAKVSLGSSVASVYSQESDITSRMQIAALEKEIAMLESSGSIPDQQYAYADIISQQLADTVLQTADQVSGGNLEAIGDAKLSIISLFNSRNAAFGRNENFAARIAQLEGERDRLAASVSGIKTDIAAPVSGYFVGTVDGWENFASLDKVLTLNAEDLEAHFSDDSRKQSSTAVGKIILGYDWYFAAVIPNEDLERLEKNEKVELSFAFDQVQNVPAKVYEIKTRAGEDSSIVVFECNTMNSNFANLRQKTIDIVFGEYKGLYVPLDAVGFDGDTVGVWISVGYEEQFREIDIIYQGNGYVISAVRDAYNEYKRYLQLGDRIIIDTTGLRDWDSEFWQDSVSVTPLPDKEELPVIPEENLVPEGFSEENNGNN